ncbi:MULTISPECIES: hypothetical protein [Deinococcus]|uniref:Uncharacterized protein n=1 Tax=Deinococcus rufus TaxID=2136097 RepID=A0ABV7Z7D6_9DEIO|nr:hypothetical protein [Deinococcus sp. AB2017081]WQE94662.1 hypothetical protein U2P90_14800 [Deinococcus sp. AB2017081]
MTLDENIEASQRFYENIDPYMCLIIEFSKHRGQEVNVDLDWRSVFTINKPKFREPVFTREERLYRAKIVDERLKKSELPIYACGSRTQRRSMISHHAEQLQIDFAQDDRNALSFTHQVYIFSIDGATDMEACITPKILPSEYKDVINAYHRMIELTEKSPQDNIMRANLLTGSVDTALQSYFSYNYLFLYLADLLRQRE